MKLNRRIIVIGIAAGTIAVVSGVGLAQAVGGGSEANITGPPAEQAKSAALKAAGGGTVLEIEQQDGDGAGMYEVEVRRTDGSQVEIHLDEAFQPVGTAADDDSGPEDEAGEGAEPGS